MQGSGGDEWGRTRGKRRGKAGRVAGEAGIGSDISYRQLLKDSTRARQGPRARSSCVVTLARTRRVERCESGGCSNGR